MKKLETYIIEKLVINKNIKAITKVNTDDEEMMINILKATFISLYLNYQEDFKQSGLSIYHIRRTKVKYDNVGSILNDYYKYNFNLENINDKNDTLHQIIHKFLDPLEFLINMRKNIKVPYISEKQNGFDIYWKDWKEYVDKNKIKGT